MDKIVHYYMWVPALTADRNGHTGEAITEIYNLIEPMLRNGDFEGVDIILNDFRLERASAEFLIAVLTATLPVKSKLKNRETVRAHASVAIAMRGEDPAPILKGL